MIQRIILNMGERPNNHTTVEAWMTEPDAGDCSSLAGVAMDIRGEMGFVRVNMNEREVSELIEALRFLSQNP